MLCGWMQVHTEQSLANVVQVDMSACQVLAQQSGEVPLTSTRLKQASSCTLRALKDMTQVLVCGTVSMVLLVWFLCFVFL